MIRKFSLAKGMFSTKISLAKGIWWKTGAAYARQKFFGVPHPHPRACDHPAQLPVLEFQKVSVYNQ